MMPPAVFDSLPRRTGLLGRIRAAEPLAYARQATLVAKDLARTINLRDSDRDIAVLVHGFFATAGVLRPLRERLEREGGIGTASFSHIPGEGVVSIAEALARLVAELPQGPRIHIIGHSLGGIAARWYVQELGGGGRVHQTISIASPFGGARVASAFPFAVGADLHKDSRLLRRVRSGHAGCPTPHVSIVAETDTTGFDVEGAAFTSGAVHLVRGLGHNAVLYDDAALELVLRTIREPATSG